MSQKDVVNKISENKRYLLKILTSLCDSADITSSTVSPSYTYVDGTSGTTTDGIYSVSIENTDTTEEALVDGQVLPAGSKVTFSGYYDPFTKQFNRLDAISYDAQSATLIIAEVA